MAKVTWKEGKVISLETRKGLFVLAQMARAPYLIVYHLFRDRDSWSDVDLDKTSVLLCAPVARQLLLQSQVSPQKLTLERRPSLPERWIAPTADSHRIVVWPGTPLVQEIMFIGQGGSLVEDRIEAREAQAPRTIVASIPFADDATIAAHELTSLRVYAEFNERLFLCHRMGKNVDPSKDLLFRRELPPDYKAYVGILAGTLPREEWLNLPSA